MTRSNSRLTIRYVVLNHATAPATSTPPQPIMPRRPPNRSHEGLAPSLDREHLLQGPAQRAGGRRLGSRQSEQEDLRVSLVHREVA